MKSFFDPNAAQQFKDRLARLRPNSERQWGKMTSPQMVAHLCKGMEQAMGEVLPPPIFPGRIVGYFLKPIVLGNDSPMRRNSPTVPGFAITDDRDLTDERRQLYGMIDTLSPSAHRAARVIHIAFLGS